MTKKSVKSRSKFKRFLVLPVQVLRSFRDLYIRGMTGCADSVHCGTGAVSCPLAQHYYFPNSKASLAEPIISCDNKELRELIRVAALGRARALNQGHEGKGVIQVVSMSRSSEMAIGRIEEEDEDDEGESIPKHVMNNLPKNRGGHVEERLFQSSP